MHLAQWIALYLMINGAIVTGCLLVIGIDWIVGKWTQGKP